jgi:membrane-associated protease RseP (regulator of RpoE activity)
MVKEFLSQRSVAYQERDVSIDRQAGKEMINLTHQNGVPVTVIDSQPPIIGFDQRQLEQALSQRQPEHPSFGVAVADASKITEQQGVAVALGAYVGKVHPGSPAARLGLAPDDIITEINAQLIANADDLQKAVGGLGAGSRVSVIFLRGGNKRAVEGVM